MQKSEPDLSNFSQARPGYKDMGQDYFEQQYKNHVFTNLKRRTRQFGYELNYVIKKQAVMLTM